jgi:hypothetical protein
LIDLNTAQELKRAGLAWTPQINDFFGLPERQMDDRIFVISDMLVTVDVLQGMQVVSFQGASEWALDYLVTTEVVWLPREDQLRQAFEAALLQSGQLEMRLTAAINGLRLDYMFQGQQVSIEGEQASPLYATGLLHVLQSDSNPPSAFGES